MSTWKQPRYPGDHVREQQLIRGNEIGFITIQQYKDEPLSVRIGSFLPGYETGGPGDTPKTNPESSAWSSAPDEANNVFDEYVRSAYKLGWVNYDRGTGHAEISSGADRVRRADNPRRVGAGRLR